MTIHPTIQHIRHSMATEASIARRERLAAQGLLIDGHPTGSVSGAMAAHSSCRRY